MSLLDFSLPGSDPNASNSFIQTPQQVAYQQELARQLMQEGSSSAPIRSPWQGVSNLAKALMGGYEMGEAQNSQRLGQANSVANNIGLMRSMGFSVDPGELNIPSTPGRTTPALQQADALGDQIQDAQEAQGTMSGTPPTGGNSTLAAGIANYGKTPAAPATNPMALAAALGAGTPYGTANVNGAGSAPQPATGGAPDPRNYPVTRDGQTAFIRDYAAFKGIDPNFALRVASAEGLNAVGPGNPNGASTVDRNPDGSPFSFGPFQLNVRNGLGTEARRAGIDPADPAQSNLANKFALDQMASGGLGPWRGDAAVSAYQAQGGGWTPPALAAINAATHGGSGGVPASASAFTGSPGAAAGASSAPAGPQGAGAQPPAPAPSQAMHPDVTALMNVLSDPWATPAQQQVAQSMLQNQLPQRPSIIDGPTDPATGYATKLVWSPTQGVLGRLDASGRILPTGGGASSPAGAQPGAAPAIPAGVDPKKYRETLAERDAAAATPSASDEWAFNQKLKEAPSYQEYAKAISTWNAMGNLAKENSPVGDTGLIDSTAKIVNPGLAVRQGTYAVYQDEQSLGNRLWGEIQKQMSQGGVLQPETRAQLMRIAYDKMQEYQRSWQVDADQGTRIAKAHGLEPDRVVPSFAPLAPFNTSNISTQKTQAAPGKPQPPAQQQPPVQGARQAPDGNWYVADPNRPGKYLRVN